MACYREDERGRRTLVRTTQAPFAPGWVAGEVPVAPPEPRPQTTPSEHRTLPVTPAEES